MSVVHSEKKKREYSLSNGEIDAVAAETEKCLQKMKYEPKNITSVRLSLEEYLLRWQSNFGENARFVFAIGKRYGRTHLLPELKGEQFNPLETDDEEMDWSNRILSNLGLRPSYSYSHGANQVRLELRQRKNNIVCTFWNSERSACNRNDTQYVYGFCGYSRKCFSYTADNCRFCR